MKNLIGKIIPSKLKNKLRDKKGSLLWEMMLVLFVLFAFMYTAVTFIGIYAQYESISYTTKTVARQIEVSGNGSLAQITADTQALLAGTPIEDIQVTIVPSNPASTFWLSSQKIQLKETFKVTVSGTYKWQIFAPSESSGGDWLSTLTINVPLSKEITGMSEVYFK